jgi:uncharacterized membrane protein YeaQ/YmgE (transglycosylase-associated protein family)
MNFVIWLVVGSIIGWIASMIMRTNAQQGMILNVVVGIVGSMLGGWLISPLVGAGTINQNDFSLGGLFVSLVGAVILLAIVNLVRRGKAR